MVRDAQGDLVVEMGVTNLFAGDPGSVPIRLISGVDLVRLTCVLEASESSLAELGLVPVAPEIGLASLRRLGPDRYELELTAAIGEVLRGTAWWRGSPSRRRVSRPPFAAACAGPGSPLERRAAGPADGA